jgi:hypothetical protein
MSNAFAAVVAGRALNVGKNNRQIEFGLCARRWRAYDSRELLQT